MAAQRLKFRCSVCGQALRNTFAIEIGIGEKCRLKLKRAEHIDPSMDLFHYAAHADFIFTVEEGIVCVVDLNSGRSVTNDAKDVVRAILEQLGPTFPGTIIYRDLKGIWDQLVVQGYRFAGFRPLSTFSKEEAKQRVRRVRINSSPVVLAGQRPPIAAASRP